VQAANEQLNRATELASWSGIVQHDAPDFSDNGLRYSPYIVTVVSAESREGKSALVANLARTLVSLNQRVVIIDADLRQPNQHELFDLPNHYGLSTVLNGDITVEDALQQTEIAWLRVLTSGPPISAPMQLLASENLPYVLKQIEEDNLGVDITLIDTPPFMFARDAAMVAQHADLTTLVVSLGHVHASDVVNVAQHLQQYQIEPVRVVLNRGNPPWRQYPYGADRVN
jgi:capsular exopolysaccharide synthesis family protein